MAAEPSIELRLPVDAYATLVLATHGARSWAAELFDAVAVAHREATGDPHALSDLEVAFLPDPDAYDPGPGQVVTEDEAGPARVRLHAAIDIEGRHLHCASLRAAVVEALAARFNATRVAVSAPPWPAGPAEPFFLSPPAPAANASHPPHHPTVPTTLPSTQRPSRQPPRDHPPPEPQQAPD